MVGSPQHVDCGVSNGQTIPCVVKSATGSIYQPPSCLIWDPAAPTVDLDFVIYKSSTLARFGKKSKTIQVFQLLQILSSESRNSEKPNILVTFFI